MKTYRILFPVVAFSLMLSSCTKLTKNTIADPNAKQHNEDVSNTKNESDNLNTDINNILKDVQGFGKTDNNAAFTVCGATVDTSHQYDPTPKVTVTFDGTTACGNPARIRSGTVTLELVQGNKWSDAGAKLKVTHTDYKVTFVNLNNHYLTFNGTKYLTNVNGFDYVGYFFNGSLTAHIRERSNDMTVTFENGQTESWNSARLSTVQITNYTTITATVNGDSISNGKTIDSWGTTRFGTHFTTEMISPWVSGTTCGWWRPTQGKYTSTTDNFSVTATCSVDQQGNVVSSGCGAYGYKIEWNYNNGTATGNAVVAYF